ncbi:CBO0543 family protein [Paenibacillus silviterrae]|uniref:CBO0543 family protein n=1 Tax=Paenibacillus silviterrae TaxID=3242194 RepID=UPI002542D2D6|nr:CBO0543 family protein [Paenibacillus chinjuensis]
MSEETIDRVILIAINLITVLLLILSTPKDKLREASIIFFFKQTMTWSFGLIVVELGLIQYPIREFVKAGGTSFSFEYFIYPSLCVIFNLRYPVGTFWKKVGWVLGFPTIMTLLEVIFERKTELINYIHWTWYWTWITLWLTFLISRTYFLWIYRNSGKGYSW